MIKKFKRIGVLTSGGDAPGMNAAVRAVTRAALNRGVEVMGIFGGYRGLIEDDMKLLGSHDVGNIINHGGTALFSDRCIEFKTEEGMAKAIANCKKNTIDGIIAIGGDGTFRGATDLSVRGIPTIGIPGTIDNDITSTDYTIGFDTAMNTVIDMVDRLRDTCESHARCNVVEVMGRGCGQIALLAGIAVGAIVIAIPEIKFNEEEAIQRILDAKALGKRNFIVIVSEGLGHYSEELAKKIQERTNIETKFARLAHVLRGGSPSLRDRTTAARMADEAVNRILDGESNLVIAERYGSIVPINISYALTVDHMYKEKLKDGDLDNFSEEEINSMKALCKERTAYIKDLYRIATEISK